MFSNTKASADIFDNVAAYGQEKVLIEAACLSTDTKPTDGIANGSACIEMDTGKTFMYDEANGEWLEVNTGGGGGGGNAENFYVTFTVIDDETGECTTDKTFAETKSAYDNNQNIVARIVNSEGGYSDTLYFPLDEVELSDDYSNFLFNKIRIDDMGTGTSLDIVLVLLTFSPQDGALYMENKSTVRKA